MLNRSCEFAQLQRHAVVSNKQHETSRCFTSKFFIYRVSKKNRYVMFNKRVGVFYHNIKHDA